MAGQDTEAVWPGVFTVKIMETQVQVCLQPVVVRKPELKDSMDWKWVRIEGWAWNLAYYWGRGLHLPGLVQVTSSSQPSNGLNNEAQLIKI